MCVMVSIVCWPKQSMLAINHVICDTTNCSSRLLWAISRTIFPTNKQNRGEQPKRRKRRGEKKKSIIREIEKKKREKKSVTIQTKQKKETTFYYSLVITNN